MFPVLYCKVITSAPLQQNRGSSSRTSNSVVDYMPRMERQQKNLMHLYAEHGSLLAVVVDIVFPETKIAFCF